MSKKKIAVSSILAFFSGFLGMTGALGWCCTITGAAILSFLGLASISAFLTLHNKLLFLLSLIFTGLAVYFYIQYKKNNNCAAK
jgi:hypothetical protein